MARSHHRKKHKEHLRQYQHSQDIISAKSKKAKVTSIFTLIGLILGFLICFFSSGSAIVLVAGAIVGGFLGYFIGTKVDAQSTK